MMMEPVAAIFQCRGTTKILKFQYYSYINLCCLYYWKNIVNSHKTLNARNTRNLMYLNTMEIFLNCLKKPSESPVVMLPLLQFKTIEGLKQSKTLKYQINDLGNTKLQKTYIVHDTQVKSQFIHNIETIDIVLNCILRDEDGN